MTGLLKAAAGLALASLAVAPASAAPDYSRGVYHDSGVRNCPNAATCELTFEPINLDVPLVTAVQASCTITLSNAAKIGELVLRRRRGAVVTQQTLAPIQALPADGTTTRYIANASTFLALPRPDRPSIKLSLRAGAVPIVTLSCAVHGTYEVAD